MHKAMISRSIRKKKNEKTGSTGRDLSVQVLTDHGQYTGTEFSR
jgi:hypothetical protein